MQIGRTKSSAVYIKDPAVSQKHARIEWTGSAYTITDLGSSNGTTVNEKEIDEDDPVEIRDGDVIVVGTDTTVKVFVAAAADQTKAEPETAPAKQPRAALGERFPVARRRESPRQNRTAPCEPVALVPDVGLVPERLAERRQDGDRAARATRRVVDE